MWGREQPQVWAALLFSLPGFPPPSGLLTFEAQDAPGKKSRGFGGEKSTMVPCLSLNQSLQEEDVSRHSSGKL